MTAPDERALLERFREWYRATPAGDAERRERILAAVRSARPPSRRFRLIGGVALAAGIVALVLGVRSLLVRGEASSAPNEIQFVLVAPGASTVALVGDFNGWDESATPMRRGGRGAPEEPWVATVTLPGERRLFTYAFIVDGTQWVADPNAPLASADDFGSPTSVLVLHDRRAM